MSIGSVMKRLFAVVALIASFALASEAALADGVLKIGRNEDSTTFDPIKTIQNVDIWVMNNMHALLVRSRDGLPIPSVFGTPSFPTAARSPRAMWFSA